MPQTILSVVADVEPTRADALRAAIVALNKAEDDCEPSYSHLQAAVPVLHFLSMTVFEDTAALDVGSRTRRRGPVLVIEANFDGAAGPFWGQVEAACGEALRQMLACCRRPRGDAAGLFDAVTAQNSKSPVAPLLEALTVLPAAGHQGNRGLDRARVLRERDLFLAARTELAKPDFPAGLDQTGLHGALRERLRGAFDWLGAPAPARDTPAAIRADWGRLIGFGVLAVLALGAPWLLLCAALRLPWVGTVALLAAAAISTLLWEIDRRCKVFTAQQSLLWLRLAGLLVGMAAAAFLVVSLLVHFAHWGAPGRPANGPLLWLAFLLTWLVGAIPGVLGMLAMLRSHETSDPAPAVPDDNPELLRAMARREDRIPQNHMGSVVHVKPGAFRKWILRAALMALNLGVRATARDGYLGAMRTIHFAHWALLEDGERLIFFSNFDGSWESYLDDFIEKAHPGLTLAWGNCQGFPPAEYLVLDGATKGAAFKAWARSSMVESLFWFSAYRDLTVNQVERNARIAAGLTAATLSPTEAAAWALDL